MTLAYGFWWTIAIPAIILFYVHAKKHIPIYLFLGVSLVCQLLSFLTMTGIADATFWLRDPYNYFWGETLALSFLLIGASSLYGKYGTLLGAVAGVVYTVLWFVNPAGWFSRFEIVSVLIVTLSAVGAYVSYRKKDSLLSFLIAFALGTSLTLALYPFAFMRSLVPQETLRVMFIVIPLIWSFIALVNSRKRASTLSSH